jgi:tubulin-specific chaperone C
MESEASKNPVFEMMAKRDRERKIANEKNQRSRQEKSELEGIDYFDSVFDTKVKEIGTRLDALEPSGDAVVIQEEFTSIAKDLQEIQRYFTSSTLFLSDHKIQKCQNIINQLVTKSDDTKARIAPKKKFGFKNKSAAPQVKAETKVDGAVKEASHKEFLWTETQKKNQVIELGPEKSNNQDLTLKEMENCVIVIKGHPGSLQMLKMKNCLVLCGPVARSIFADACENCTFAFTCQQLRLHSSTMCDIYMLVTSRAIIEDCRDIHFAPSTYTYEGYEDDLLQSGLDGSVNNWENIGDFNWLSTDKQSPNWSRIEDIQKVADWSDFVEGFKTRHEVS